MTIAKEINCSHCGAPLPVQPGEILSTCRYCGFTSVIDTGKAFEFEHSLMLNTVQESQAFDLARNWMGSSFIAPRDLQEKSALIEQNLVYLPFWVVSADAKTEYKGVLERITPASEQQGEISNRYDWLVLARRTSDFPTRSYHLAVTGKIPFDATRIEKGAKILNSEMDVDEAVAQARDDIENLHDYLAKQKIDRIVDSKTEFNITGTYYLHAPVWFITYGYKNARYQLLMDGASGEIVKGDLPNEDFKLL